MNTSSITTNPPLDIQIIRVEQSRQLRAAVLRPGQPPHTLVFTGDDAADTLHLGAFSQNQLVGIVSIMHLAPQDYDGQDADKLWLLRGMATLPEARGQGQGLALVRTGCAYVASQQGTYLWCDARQSAAGFYTKLGFVIHGGLFDMPISGPHYRMWRAITPADASHSSG